MTVTTEVLEPPAIGHLRGEAVPVRAIGPAELEPLFALYRRQHGDAEFLHFEQDFREKHWVLLLRGEDGSVCGFSTQKLFDAADSEGQLIRVLYSSDAILESNEWGEQELVRAWCRFAGQALAQEPDTPLYWMIASNSVRTYLCLSFFFREYWPRKEQATPELQQRLLSSLARVRFGYAYDEASGLVRLPEGPQLVCLAPLSPDNVRGLAAKSLREGLALGPLRLGATV